MSPIVTAEGSNFIEVAADEVGDEEAPPLQRRNKAFRPSQGATKSGRSRSPAAATKGRPKSRSPPGGASKRAPRKKGTASRKS